MTVLLRLYLLATAAFPFVLNHAATRAHARQHADPDRLPERSGHATKARPTGRLIWFHAASVGEFLATADLAQDMARLLPHAQILITTHTATSAAMVAGRAPAAIHQFLPVDTPAATTAFLDHWRPDLAIIAESDLWPRLILQSAQRGIPMALVNVRPSRTRSRAPRTAAALLSRFGCITTQSDAVGDALTALGLDPGRIVATGDLKADAAPLPFDPAGLTELNAMIGARPVWVAASTHAADEAPVIAAHRIARATHPDLLLILIPRHPDRAAPLRVLLEQAAMKVAQRSAGEPILPDIAVYLADTLGETGLFYRAAPLVFLGGSFGPEGGHNPYEPATLGAALLHGPHVRHFEAAFADLDSVNASRPVATGEALGQVVANLTRSPDLDRMRHAARAFMGNQTGARARTLALILALLPPND